MQLMQIVGERNVRIVPDVVVSGANGNPGMVDGLLGLMLTTQSSVLQHKLQVGFVAAPAKAHPLPDLCRHADAVMAKV
jgi:hypothetical protein